MFLSVITGKTLRSLCYEIVRDNLYFKWPKYVSALIYYQACAVSRCLTPVPAVVRQSGAHATFAGHRALAVVVASEFWTGKVSIRMNRAIKVLRNAMGGRGVALKKKMQR